MQFVNLSGVKALLKKIKETFTTKDEVSMFDYNTETYVRNIDYSLLEFDTNLIIGSTSAPMVGSAIVGQTYLN